jgi:phage terminase Nu1 subunit (DNA packaging protein)
MDTRNKINRERYENDPEYRKKKQEYARERMRLQREKKKAQKVEEAK